MKSNNYQSIVRDKRVLDSVKNAHLSLEEKYKAQATASVGEWCDKMERALESSLSRVLNDKETIVGLSLCTGNAVETWQSDQSSLRVKSDINGIGTSAFVMIDYDTVFQLATISFGGSNSKNTVGEEERKELTPSEKRVGLRCVMTQISALQKVLLPDGAIMPTEEISTIDSNSTNEHLTFKVRASFSDEIVSWYIWLPVGLFVQQSVVPPSSHSEPLMVEDGWRELPVKCDIELARRMSNVIELEQFLAGQLMPIELKDIALLSLGKQALFEGKVLEDEENLHFKVEHSSADNK